MRYGRQAEWFVELARDGFEVEALTERPELHPIHAELWEAFNVLSASRSIGMGSIGYIPLAEIACYATVIGYERVADFIAIIRALDGEFVKHQNERADDGRSQATTHD